DSDGDGIPDGDNINSKSWMDTDDDNDGHPDSDDEFPEDPKKWEKQEKERAVYNNIMTILLVIIIIIIIAMALIFLFVKKMRRGKVLTDDEILMDVKHKILHGEHLDELEYSRDDIENVLERQFQKGEISNSTYNFIKFNILESGGHPPDNYSNNSHMNKKS
ncbi:MAG: hypothetical protein JSV49_00485, partial [Thermoplasmata archaeon]